MTHAGEYRLSDEAHARLLDYLSRDDFRGLTPDLREDILTYYRDENAPVATKKKASAWEKTREELERLKSVTPSEAPAIQITEIP
jgi:hypothetical protein